MEYREQGKEGQCLMLPMRRSLSGTHTNPHWLPIQSPHFLPVFSRRYVARGPRRRFYHPLTALKTILIEGKT